jgi:cytochrome c biogenesis protein CcmG, thiol:disulfide interchange protein DsbE
VVMNFFASWCTPCKREAPMLERTWRAYKGRGVRFVGVATHDSRTDARTFVARQGITYPVVIDGEGSLTRAMGLFGLPETFFISPEWRFSGVQAGQQLRNGPGPAVLGAISPRELRTQIERLSVTPKGDG